jgi:hypothetical protein
MHTPIIHSNKLTWQNVTTAISNTPRELYVTAKMSTNLVKYTLPNKINPTYLLNPSWAQK